MGRAADVPTFQWPEAIAYVTTSYKSCAEQPTRHVTFPEYDCYLSRLEPLNGKDKRYSLAKDAETRPISLIKSQSESDKNRRASGSEAGRDEGTHQKKNSRPRVVRDYQALNDPYARVVR